MRKNSVFLAATVFVAAFASALLAADDAASVKERLKNARTPEERRAIIQSARQTRQQAAPAGQAAGTADAAGRRKKMEERLAGDPDALQMFRLRESLRSAKSEQERAGIRKQISELSARRAAAAEAKLTPEQKAGRAARAAKMAAMRAELVPLREKMRAAGTPEERKSVQGAIREVMRKYEPGR